MDKLIVTAWRTWKRRNMPRGMEVEIYHVTDFISDLCADGTQLERGASQAIYVALREAGEADYKGEHLSLGNAYVGRPEGRAAWEKWRARRRASLDRV